MYKLIIERLYKDANMKGMINLGRARYILGFTCRVPRQLISSVFAEMQRMDLITINGQRFVYILVSKDDLEME